MATMSKDQLIEAIGGMTIIELSDLVKGIEDKFGVKAAPVGGGAVAAAAPAAAAEEQTEFAVWLKSSDPAKKINVIKIVRELTGLGLKESKDLVEGAPKEVKAGLDKKASDEMKKKLEEAGGVVELK